MATFGLILTGSFLLVIASLFELGGYSSLSPLLEVVQLLLGEDFVASSLASVTTSVSSSVASSLTSTFASSLVPVSGGTSSGNVDGYENSPCAGWYWSPWYYYYGYYYTCTSDQLPVHEALMCSSNSGFISSRTWWYGICAIWVIVLISWCRLRPRHGSVVACFVALIKRGRAFTVELSQDWTVVKNAAVFFGCEVLLVMAKRFPICRQRLRRIALRCRPYAAASLDPGSEEGAQYRTPVRSPSSRRSLSQLQREASSAASSRDIAPLVAGGHLEARKMRKSRLPGAKRCYWRTSYNPRVGGGNCLFQVLAKLSKVERSASSMRQQLHHYALWLLRSNVPVHDGYTLRQMIQKYNVDEEEFVDKFDTRWGNTLDIYIAAHMLNKNIDLVDILDKRVLAASRNTSRDSVTEIGYIRHHFVLGKRRMPRTRVPSSYFPRLCCCDVARNLSACYTYVQGGARGRGVEMAYPYQPIHKCLLDGTDQRVNNRRQLALLEEQHYDEDEILERRQPSPIDWLCYEDIYNRTWLMDDIRRLIRRLFTYMPRLRMWRQYNRTPPIVRGGGAPTKRHAAASSTSPGPQVALIYHGSFGPLHAGHIAALQSAHALLQHNGVQVMTMVMGFTLPRRVNKKEGGALFSDTSKRVAMAKAVLADERVTNVILDPQPCGSAEVLGHKYAVDGLLPVYVVGDDIQPKLRPKSVIVYREENPVNGIPTHFEITTLSGACRQVRALGCSATDVRLQLQQGKVHGSYGPCATEVLEKMLAHLPVHQPQPSTLPGPEAGERTSDARRQRKRPYPCVNQDHGEQQEIAPVSVVDDLPDILADDEYVHDEALKNAEFLGNIAEEPAQERLTQRQGRTPRDVKFNLLPFHTVPRAIEYVVEPFLTILQREQRGACSHRGDGFLRFGVGPKARSAVVGFPEPEFLASQVRVLTHAADFKNWVVLEGCLSNWDFGFLHFAEVRQLVRELLIKVCRLVRGQAVCSFPGVALFCLQPNMHAVRIFTKVENGVTTERAAWEISMLANKILAQMDFEHNLNNMRLFLYATDFPDEIEDECNALVSGGSCSGVEGCQKILNAVYLLVESSFVAVAWLGIAELLYIIDRMEPVLNVEWDYKECIHGCVLVLFDVLSAVFGLWHEGGSSSDHSVLTSPTAMFLSCALVTLPVLSHLILSTFHSRDEVSLWQLRVGGAASLVCSSCSTIADHIDALVSAMHAMKVHVSALELTQKVELILKDKLQRRAVDGPALLTVLRLVDQQLGAWRNFHFIKRDYIRGAFLELALLADTLGVGLTVTDEVCMNKLHMPGRSMICLQLDSDSLDFKVVAVTTETNTLVTGAAFSEQGQVQPSREGTHSVHYLVADLLFDFPPAIFVDEIESSSDSTSEMDSLPETINWPEPVTQSKDQGLVFSVVCCDTRIGPCVCPCAHRAPLSPTQLFQGAGKLGHGFARSQLKKWRMSPLHVKEATLLSSKGTPLTLRYAGKVSSNDLLAAYAREKRIGKQYLRMLVTCKGRERTLRLGATELRTQNWHRKTILMVNKRHVLRSTTSTGMRTQRSEFSRITDLQASEIEHDLLWDTMANGITPAKHEVTSLNVEESLARELVLCQAALEHDILSQASPNTRAIQLNIDGILHIPTWWKKRHLIEFLAGWFTSKKDDITVADDEFFASMEFNATVKHDDEGWFLQGAGNQTRVHRDRLANAAAESLIEVLPSSRQGLVIEHKLVKFIMSADHKAARAVFQSDTVAQKYRAFGAGLKRAGLPIVSEGMLAAADGLDADATRAAHAAEVPQQHIPADSDTIPSTLQYGSDGEVATEPQQRDQTNPAPVQIPSVDGPVISLAARLERIEDHLKLEASHRQRLEERMEKLDVLRLTALEKWAHGIDE
eukprot:174943-Amphidinium_carterae.1